jgi:hypothetical protein
VRTAPTPSLQVDYDILLSPTYRVPVLYFRLKWNHHNGPVGLDAVYQYVVPEQYRKGLQSVGVMGGISLGVCMLARSRRLGILTSSSFSVSLRSTIPNRAPRPFSCTRATPRTRWRTWRTHRTSLRGCTSSSGSVWSVTA